MTFENIVRDEYFEWLYNYVCEGRAHGSVSYIKLFMLLHDIEFKFYIPRDVNRAKDGVNLRYRFAMIKDDDNVIDILDGPCSILEMIVALAIRCEEAIMDDTRYGDRTSQWFWIMMSNVGISSMTDSNFDKEFVEGKIYDLIERRYESNGKGGLFYIRDCDEDLRDIEIWSQLCWYLDKLM